MAQWFFFSQEPLSRYRIMIKWICALGNSEEIKSVEEEKENLFLPFTVFLDKKLILGWDVQHTGLWCWLCLCVCKHIWKNQAVPLCWFFIQMDMLCCNHFCVKLQPINHILASSGVQLCLRLTSCWNLQEWLRMMYQSKSSKHTWTEWRLLPLCHGLRDCEEVNDDLTRQKGAM